MDEHVEPAECLHSVCDSPAALLGVAQVGLDEMDAPPEADHGLCRLPASTGAFDRHSPSRML